MPPPTRVTAVPTPMSPMFVPCLYLISLVGRTLARLNCTSFGDLPITQSQVWRPHLHTSSHFQCWGPGLQHTDFEGHQSTHKAIFFKVSTEAEGETVDHLGSTVPVPQQQSSFWVDPLGQGEQACRAPAHSWP